jgi:hypothetical protein
MNNKLNGNTLIHLMVDLVVGVRILLKSILKEKDRKAWIIFGPLASGYISFLGFLDTVMNIRGP